MGFKDQMDMFNQKVNSFIGFIGDKLSNFSSLSRGEQVSYGSIGLGIILILASLVLFVI